MTAVAIVPAAGRSERFGSPKMRSLVNGEPMLTRALRCLLDARVARAVIVVSHADVFTGVPLVDDPRVRVVVNPAPERGMFSSIQTGLAAAEGDPILILPGDMPFVGTPTVRAVLEAYARRPGLVVPQRHARHGHPIALPGSARTAILASLPTSTLDAVIKSLALPRAEVDVEDPGILHDVDTPADLMGRDSG
jgi:molybdenum cofactor cytidylyltransferase